MNHNCNIKLLAMGAFLALLLVLFGVGVWLHVECRNLEARLVEKKATANAVTSSPVESSHPRESQSYQEEMAAVDAERQRLVDEIAELKEDINKIQEANKLTMAELAELAPDAYMSFAEELKKYYAGIREGRNVLCDWEMLRVLEDDGLLKMKPEDRKICEEYLSSYQEYMDGVLNNSWTEEETERRYQELKKKHRDEYGRFLGETLEYALREAIGVETYDKVDSELENTFAMGAAFAMTPYNIYNWVLSKRYAREILEKDRPPLDYGLSRQEKWMDVAVRQLEESFAAKREQP